MPSPEELIPDLEISSDERIRVFRRTFHGMKAFEGMEVDAYIVITDCHVIVLDGKTTSPDQVKQNLFYIRKIERRCKSVLQKRKPGANDLVHVSELINYPFNEVVGKTTGTIDRAFYTQAHENNCQAIMKWLMKTL